MGAERGAQLVRPDAGACVRGLGVDPRREQPLPPHVKRSSQPRSLLTMSVGAIEARSLSRRCSR